MDFTRLIITLHNLSLKKALAGVFLLSLTLSIPIVVLLLRNETNIFSEASLSESTTQEIDESKIPYPTSPPSVMHITKFYGRPGDSVLVYGDNFGDAQKESRIIVGKNVIPRSDVLYWSNNEIEFSLPSQEGIHRLTIDVNGNNTTWYGRVNIYTALTPDVLFIDEDENFIKVPNSNYKLKVYSISGEVNIFGSGEVENSKRQVPLDLTNSNILYVELIKNGRISNFRVEQP